MFFLFFIYIFNCLTIIIFNCKKQLDIGTRTTIKMVPKHFFQSIYLISKRLGIKNKRTTGPPGNIRNYNLQAFLSSKLTTDCGSHILHTQLPLATALLLEFEKKGKKFIIVTMTIWFTELMIFLENETENHNFQRNKYVQYTLNILIR